MKYGYQLISRPVPILQMFKGISIGMDMSYGSNMMFGVVPMFDNEHIPSWGNFYKTNARTEAYADFGYSLVANGYFSEARQQLKAEIPEVDW